jgi:hypothetical protein
MFENNGKLYTFYNENADGKGKVNEPSFKPDGQSVLKSTLIDATGTQSDKQICQNQLYAAPEHFLKIDDKTLMLVFNESHAYQLGLLRFR